MKSLSLLDQIQLMTLTSTCNLDRMSWFVAQTLKIYNPLENISNCGLLFLTERFGHLHSDRNVQISLLRREIVNWHALAFDLQHLSRLRDSLLSELHCVTIEVSNAIRPAEQSVLQRDLEVHLQVVSVACKETMFLLLENDDDMARVQIGVLISLVLEDNLLAVLHSALDVESDLVRLRHQLLSVADMAGLVKDLSLASALRTGLLHLLDEPRGKLNTLENNSRTLTNGTLPNMIWVVRSCSVAMLAQLFAVDVERLLSSVVQLLQSDRNRSLHVLVPLLSSEASEAKNIERIETLLTSLLLSFRYSFLSARIIHSPFVVIRKAVISILDINVSFLAFLGLTLVRMILKT